MDKLNRAWKNKNAAEYIYYQQQSSAIAFSDYEIFAGSWAGQLWLKKNKNEIESFAAERLHRFGEKWKTR